MCKTNNDFQQYVQNFHIHNTRKQIIFFVDNKYYNYTEIWKMAGKYKDLVSLTGLLVCVRKNLTYSVISDLEPF